MQSLPKARPALGYGVWIPAFAGMTVQQAVPSAEGAKIHYSTFPDEPFVFIGVWVDRILYWVLTNEEAKRHPTRSHQHRGGVEYQIGITDKNFGGFKRFLVPPSKIVEKILQKAKGGKG